MYDKKSRGSRQRGAAAIEFGLAIPVLLMAVAGGLALGRALVVRHNFADAVSFATRMSAVNANGSPAKVNGASIQSAIVARMPPRECSGVDVQARVEAQAAFGGVQAVLVVATCTVEPLFGGAWASLNIPNFIVNAAFPL
jgi:Flp pilus assembly protein TadG